jgi:tetratricopeptide (TPR) repeat protein
MSVIAGPRLVDVECPGCGTRLSLPIHQVIRFPEDAELVLDCVQGRLNAHECPVCRKVARVESPVGIVHSESLEALVTRWSDQAVGMLRAQLKSELGLPPSIRVLRDDRELKQAVLAWTNEFMRRVAAPLFGGSPGDRQDAADEPSLYHAPLALLVRQAQARGELSADVQTDPPIAGEVQRAFLADLYLAQVSDVLRDLVVEAVTGVGISGVLDLVRERIPARVFDEALLDHLAGECRGWYDALPAEHKELSERARHELINAVAHAVAGRGNPRALEWALFAFKLFELERKGRLTEPDKMRLETPLLNATVRFADAWDLSAATMDPRDVDDQALTDAWFERLGMMDRYAEMWASGVLVAEFSVPEGMTEEELAAELVDKLKETLAADDFAGLAGPASQQIFALVRGGHSRAARRLAEIVLDQLAAAGAWEEVATIAIAGSNAFNQAFDHGTAANILNRQIDGLQKAHLPPASRSDLLNEIGNAMRYAGVYDQALKAYEKSKQLLDHVSAKNERVIERNRAIVLRAEGRFNEAARVLEGLAAESAGEWTAASASVLVSLALLYVDVGLPEPALRHAFAALEIPLSPTDTRVKLAALMATLTARAQLCPGVALPEAREALELAREHAALKVIAACTVLDLDGRAELGEDVVASARAALEQQVAAVDGGLDQLSVLAIGALGRWHLRRDEFAAVESLVRPVVETAETPYDVPWQLAELVGRVAEEAADHHLAWGAFRSVRRRLEEGLPGDTELRFATPWLAGKEEVQGAIARTTRRAVELGFADVSELLDVFEFANARDVPGSKGEVMEARERLYLLEGVDATLVAFVETESTLDVVVADLRNGSFAEPVRFGIAPDEVRAAASSFGGLIGPGCVLKSQMARAEAALQPVLDELGRLLDAKAPDAHHICLLPSGSLVGLPLHAACATGGTPVLERAGVSVAPNLRVLHRTMIADTTTEVASQPSVIAVVGSEVDSEDFVARLEICAGRLGEGKARELPRLEASKDHCLDALSTSQHFVFLGHGAEAGALYGRGLCVSDGTRLPRAPLPVDLVPELRRFVIDAADLEALPRTSAIVVSLACSSGRSRPGPGGTRVGLERSLFARGTRVLLAPVWDVEHTSALAFLEHFYDSWRSEPDVSLGEHHRRACVAVRAEHPLLYHWAPFVLNGAFVWR